MTLPEVVLDDLRFQSLVDECRTRIAELCPEWTNRNVSDPGITLIELFAWMTEQLSYRINRIPEKLNVALLSLLDVHLFPPEAARTELRLWLEKAAGEEVEILGWATEVSTARTPGRDPVVFHIASDFTIKPLELTAYLLDQGDELLDVLVRNGEARPEGDARKAFGKPPARGDALLLGFSAVLDRLIVRIDVTCASAHGLNIRPDSPPLRWEAWAWPQSDRSAGAPVSKPTWVPVTKLSDTTEGFNESDGTIELALPSGLALDRKGSYRAQWLRCVLTEDWVPATEGAGARGYSAAPEISRLSTAAIGATLPAQHCQRVENELLGRSDGTPGQVMRMQRAPVLGFAAGEGIEVIERGGKRVQWTEVETFAHSQPEDEHYILNAADGEIEFGPVVRQRDGTFRRYGAIPATGAEVRVKAYRHGGGTLGNVAAGSLTHLRQSIPKVRSVTHPAAATGGVDGETLGSARARLAIELGTRNRAITAADFEELARTASERVARVRCLSGGPGQARLLVIPQVANPVYASPVELTPDEDILAALKASLEPRRLVGQTITITPPVYRVVTVVASITPAPYADRDDLERRVKERLNTFLNPVVGGQIEGPGHGWEFGGPLRLGELSLVINWVEEVERLDMLMVYPHDPKARRVRSTPLEDDLVLAADEVIASGTHQVRVGMPRIR